MSHFLILHDIANNPTNKWDPIPEFIQNNKTTNVYRDFLIYTALSLQTCIIEQRNNIQNFLFVYQDILTGVFRITKYDTNFMDYYRLMIAIYGQKCQYFNADYSINISTAIILDIIHQLSIGCIGCSSTNLLHSKLMHW
jgi:hypothetical protein